MKTTLLFLSVFLSANLFGQNVYIPDANFKAYLVGNPAINTNNDVEIQVSEASSFDGQMDCGALNISDLTGIEAFVSLTNLRCYENQLTSLDVTQNTALIWFDCSNNLLTSIDVSQNVSLQSISCSGNQLTSIDVSHNIALALLSCDENQLTSLDVIHNTALFWLKCSNNQLTSLDLSHNTSFAYWDCQSNQLTCLNISNGNYMSFGGCVVNNNPNLTCIEVDDEDWLTANWNNWNDPLDSQMYFSENCNNDCSNSSSLTELTSSKTLIQILDLMGRETTFKPNTPLIYVYDDGSTEKVFSVEY